MDLSSSEEGSTLLDTVIMVLWDILCYLSTPRVILSHAICLALLWHLYRQGTGLKVLGLLTILEEAVTFALWWAIPNSWATILTLAASVYAYEKLLGPRIFVKKNAVLVSDDDLSESLRYYNPTLQFDVEQRSDGQYYLSTHLQYAEYVHSFWSKISPSNEPVSTNDVISVHDGCDYAIIRSIRSAGAESRRCFHISLDGNEKKTVTFIAESEEKRDEWMQALRQFFDLKVDDLKTTWLTQLGQNELPSDGVKLDDLFHVLEKANRKTEKAYIADIYRTAAKKGNVHKSSNGEIVGLDTESFSEVFDLTTGRPDIKEIYDGLLDKQRNHMLLSPKRFHQFVIEEQKENPSHEETKSWIKKFETVIPSLNLTQIGFTSYLMSEEHSIRHRNQLSVCQNMTHPLSHYFIATSHNTYLTKDQLKGKSSVDAYISVFKRGCKCVELDCWDGPNNEPIIFHGHTLTSKILFKDVIQAIKEYAFHCSEYPVILSFENHCSVEQQRVMAQHLKDMLQDKLYPKAIPEDEKHLPSPEDLKGYVIVKNKKLKAGVDETEEGDDEFSDEEITEADIEEVVKNDEESSDEKEKKASTIRGLFDSVKGLQRTSSKKKHKVPKIAQELSDLVSYCQATTFRAFDYSQENAKHYEMSSFAEKRAMKFAKEDHQKFIRYNKRQMSRIYPAGGRIDSSNYDPVPLWCVGSQLVALNYQTASREMQLNQGIFQCNGGCGYVLKPEFLTRDDMPFNPLGPFEVQKVVTIKIISGHQLPFSNEKSLKTERGMHVQLRVSGIEDDNAKEKTKTTKNNGFNPVWNEELTVKLRVPDLALISLNVFSGDSLLAQFTLPFFTMQQGYRSVHLQNKFSEPLPYSSLFVHVAIANE